MVISRNCLNTTRVITRNKVALEQRVKLSCPLLKWVFRLITALGNVILGNSWEIAAFSSALN